MTSQPKSTSPSRVYIAGSAGGHSIGPPAHNYIAKQLGKAWHMEFLQRPTAQAVMDVLRQPDFAGAAVTMPHKKTIIPYLDKIDDLVSTIGACNAVYRAPGGELHGTNIDWIGIEGALRAGPPFPRQDAGMIYGAGGASRAAVYTLAVRLGYREIYVVNRDDGEVADLMEDVKAYDSSIRPTIIHVRTAAQAATLPAPACIVGTVPDFEPTSAGEVEAKNVLVEFLSKEAKRKGVMLDMCYHPRETRNIRLAKQHGWAIIEGTQVVARQIKAQWKLWTGQEISDQCEREAMAILDKSANDDLSVTPRDSNLQLKSSL